MPKKLCKLSKSDIKKNKLEITKLVKNPKYICTDCARVSKQKNTLCEPEEIKS